MQFTYVEVEDDKMIHIAKGEVLPDEYYGNNCFANRTMCGRYRAPHSSADYRDYYFSEVDEVPNLAVVCPDCLMAALNMFRGGE